MLPLHGKARGISKRRGFSRETKFVVLVLVGVGAMFAAALLLFPYLEDKLDEANHAETGHHHDGVRVEDDHAPPPPAPSDSILKGRDSEEQKSLEQERIEHQKDLDAEHTRLLEQQRQAAAAEKARAHAAQESAKKPLKRVTEDDEPDENPPAVEVSHRNGNSKFRADGRCGPRFPAPGAPDFGECDPNADEDQKGPCCNPNSGWCGNIRGADWGHCPPDCESCIDFSAHSRKEESKRDVPIKRDMEVPSDAILTLEPGTYDSEGNLRVMSDSDLISKRDFVKNMMKVAWSGYRKNAFGDNELMPKAKRGHSAGIFGSSKMGATVVDALDTLYIMGMKEELAEAREWVATRLDFNVGASVSVFEVTIRFVGGLLSAYAMTGDDVYKQKAFDLAERLLPAFNTPTGVPLAQINLKTGTARNWGWAAGRCSILSEFGTMQLEFEYLSLITGDSRFANVIKKVTDYVVAKQPADGLYPNFLHPNTGRWGSAHISVGALGDSFYEYLLKMWVFRGGRAKDSDLEGRKPYDSAMRPIMDKLVFKSSKSQLTYVAEMKGGRVEHKMGHLACFIGGLFQLGIKGAPADLKVKYGELGEEVTKTCHESYDRTASKIGPETMYFSGAEEATCARVNERYYILRPEVIEAYFYSWRLTHKPIYRQFAWEAAQAIEKHCRCGEGYCGLRDVNKASPGQDDVQQSFFLAETLKYLYLIFSDDDLVSLDKWVFNTEAHPVPIQLKSN
eukprot:m.338677 g.338677  ORF g.338677 m.338677 type:complete len:734 (-) comp18502_c0_seq1:111-2312(-)